MQDGGVYLLGTDGEAESILTCREAVLGRLTHVVDDSIRDLCELWEENRDAVLPRLRNATADITTHQQLADLIKSTIDELEKVTQLNLKRLGAAVTCTPVEEVVVATRKHLWDRMGIRMKRPILIQAPEENKRTNPFTLLKQTFRLLRGTKATESLTPAPVSPPATPAGCSGASIALANTATTSATIRAGISMALLPTSMAKELRSIISELCEPTPPVQGIAEPVRDTPSDNEQVEDQGPLKPDQEELRRRILSKSLDPLISRMQTAAKSSMIEGLNVMWDLAQGAVKGALVEYDEAIERQLKALGSDDYAQLDAMTLERLNCWGNLVAALSAIREMKEMWNEPVVQVARSRPSSTFLVASPGMSPLSPRSISPSITTEVPCV